jgi:GNAT superfamily N-acetyltransferase
MAPVVAIRAATQADARAIAEVHVASWRWAYRDLVPEGFLEQFSVADRERQWIESLRGGVDRIVVASHDDEVVGFASAGPSRDDDALPGTAELFSLYLLQRFQGRGVGGPLLGDVVSGLVESGHERATLWVLETNILARRFYEREGWAWDGTTSAHQVQCANLPIVRYAVDLPGGTTKGEVPRSR